MKLFFPTLFAFVFGMALSAQADEVSSSLRFIGLDICQKALDGQHPQFDTVEFREWLAADGTSADRFCGCVAERYATHGDQELLRDIQSELIADDTYFALNMTMHENMSQCRSHLLQTDDVVDGDLAEADTEVDHEDVRMCLLTLSGDLPLIAGLNAEEVQQHLEQSHQDAGDICACAAGFIAEQGNPLKERIDTAENPQQVYGAALQSGIELCMEI